MVFPDKDSFLDIKLSKFCENRHVDCEDGIPVCDTCEEKIKNSARVIATYDNETSNRVFKWNVYKVYHPKCGFSWGGMPGRTTNHLREINIVVAVAEDEGEKYICRIKSFKTSSRRDS